MPSIGAGRDGRRPQTPTAAPGRLAGGGAAGSGMREGGGGMKWQPGEDSNLE